MIPENSAAIVTNAVPDIHVWLRPTEAAAMLGVSESVIDGRIECGDLETRVTVDNDREVLIRMPRRTGVPMAAAFSTDRRIKADDQMVSNALSARLAESNASDQAIRSKAARSRRELSLSTRLAWTSVAAMFIASCGLGLIASQRSDSDRTQARTLSGDLQAVAAKAQALASEQADLRDRLAEARRAATEAEGQLAVERNVEDQLLNAAIAAHNAKAARPNPAVLADSSR